MTTGASKLEVIYVNVSAHYDKSSHLNQTLLAVPTFPKDPYPTGFAHEQVSVKYIWWFEGQIYQSIMISSRIDYWVTLHTSLISTISALQLCRTVTKLNIYKHSSNRERKVNYISSTPTVLLLVYLFCEFCNILYVHVLTFFMYHTAKLCTSKCGWELFDLSVGVPL